MQNLFKILFVACCLLPLALPAQDSTLNLEPEVWEDADEEAYLNLGKPATPATPPREAAPVALRQVPENQWKKATGDLDFSKDQPDEPKPKQAPTKFPTMNTDWSFWGKLLQVVAVLIAVFGLGYAIYRMMQAPSNRQIARDGALITFDNVEDYLHESDLDRFLREALAAGNFTLALRFHFLQILKMLSEKQAIQWAREKTNRDYLREMRPNRLFAEFEAVTQTYERVWYGNISLDKTVFAQLETPFKNFKQQLAADGRR